VTAAQVRRVDSRATGSADFGSASSGRTAGGADAGLVEIPFGGLAAHELQRAGGVVQRGFHGRRGVDGGVALDQAIVDRHHGHAGLEQAVDIGEALGALLAAADPAAAVDDEDQRCRDG
jgi:hypothetical protein